MRKVWDRRQEGRGWDVVTLNGEPVFAVVGKNRVLADKVVDLLNHYEKARRDIKEDLNAVE